MSVTTYAAHDEPSSLRSAPVLLYHQIATKSVEDDPLRLAVSPEAFEAQISYLHRNGYRSVTLAELTTKMSEGGAGKDKLVAITFDDGYLDNFTNAFPIMQKFGFTATIFITTGYVGKANSWDSGQTPLMDWDQIKQMADYGVSFQSHSVSHAALVTLSDNEVIDELVQSRECIHGKLGCPVMHLAYPFGYYDERIISLTQKAGYQWAWAAGLAAGNRFSMERFQIKSIDSKIHFVLKTSRWGAKIRKVRANLFPVGLNKG